MDKKSLKQDENLKWEQETLELEGLHQGGTKAAAVAEAVSNRGWEAIVEAVLFTMGQSVEVRQLAAALEQDEQTARTVVLALQERYEKEHRGMQIIELEQSFQMCTRAEFYENLIRVAAAPKKQVLTEVVLETLSIVAYKQPVTKAEIAKIRGVASDHAVNRLVEYGLIYEVGRLDAPGRPALFATTEEFLRRFGVGSLIDLPSMRPEQEEAIRAEVEEELQWKEGAVEQAAVTAGGDEGEALVMMAESGAEEATEAAEATEATAPEAAATALEITNFRQDT